MLTKAPKGTKDILPSEVYKWQYIEKKIAELCNSFGYKEIRIPVFEHTELFQRGVGDTTDIVQKEMYTFQDKGGRSITLRPEGTAGVVRSYIENGMASLPMPIKLYYNITAYRYENVQKGRYREFHQFGVEAFGSYSPGIDVEIMVLAMTFLKGLGLDDLKLCINSIGCSKCRQEYKKALKSFFPENDMSRMVTIISDKHYKRLKGLLSDGRIILGGRCDDERRFIEPTLIDNVDLSSPIMKEEIFGPILPVIAYDNLDECINIIRSLPKPLALYVFSEDRKTINKIFRSCSFGGGCINDTILHLANPRLPFGGVGNSGMGSYHGKKSFETFTHYRSVLKQSSKFDIPLRYMPYTDNKLKLLKNILR